VQFPELYIYNAIVILDPHRIESHYLAMDNAPAHATVKTKEAIEKKGLYLHVAFFLLALIFFFKKKLRPT
jgi:hypothetical protein